MPRYAFYRSDQGWHPEPVFRSLGNDEDARMAAVEYAAAVLGERPDIVWSGRDLEVQVADECGSLLFAVLMTANGEPRPMKRRQVPRSPVPGSKRAVLD